MGLTVKYMIIRHNLNALNSYNELNGNIAGVKKSSEKLASGFRINRAADDSAGLAISEKMRSQLRGLSQARRNAQDGINFIQTAEGALGEIHGVLQRCRELAAESANGTYRDSVDREAVQLEFEQLRSEVDHMAMTDFNMRHCFEVEGSRFVPAYDHTKDPALISEQIKLGLISGTGEIQTSHNSQFSGYSPAQLLVNLDSGEKLSIALRFNETTFFDLPESEIDDVIGKYGSSVSRDAIKRFAEKLKTDVVPAVLAGIAGKLPDIAAKRTKNGIELGLDLYVANNSTLASVTSSGNSFKLSVNMKTVEASGGEIELSPDLWSTIAHEMTHAVMFDTTSSGMLGWGTPAVDKLPSWFIEGSAEVVGGGMDRLRDLIPWENNSSYPDYGISIGTPGTPLSQLIANPSTTDDIKTWMKKLTNSSATGEAPSYEQGYAASMYLSWLAGGGTENSSAPVNASTIAKGLDKILIEINGGKSLSQVIDELTGTKYKGLNDFVGSIQSGDESAAQFVYDLIRQSGAKNAVKDDGSGGISIEMNASGSIIAPGGLGGSKDGLTALGGSDGHFTLILEKNEGGFIYGEPGSGNTITFPNGDYDKYKELFEGGGASKNSKGEVYVEGSADKTDPDKPGGGGTDPTDPDKPGGGGTDPTDPDKPGGGGTDPTDPDKPGGGGTDPTDPAKGPIYVFMDDLTPIEPFVLQLGARSKDAVHFTFEYNSDAIGDLKCDMNCTAQGLGINALSLKTQEAANGAIDKLDHAINKISLMRATFGAVSNRLEHKIDNLTTIDENITEAESHIRDADMATEMMTFTKGQILSQAAQTILSQANQLPQSVLQLIGQ